MVAELVEWGGSGNAVKVESEGRAHGLGMEKERKGFSGTQRCQLEQSERRTHRRLTRGD